MIALSKITSMLTSDHHLFFFNDDLDVIYTTQSVILIVQSFFSRVCKNSRKCLNILYIYSIYTTFIFF
jgi:hypothetical protein